MKLYKAKPNTWFDAGTYCKLIDAYGDDYNFALFEGMRTINKGTPNEQTYLDEEVCNLDEFEIEERDTDVPISR